MIKQHEAFLTPALCEQIDRWIAKFPADQKQSAVIAALTLAQEAHGGWLTEGIMDEVADYLAMTKIAVYEVASFYSMFRLEPTGRNKLNVCNSITCMLRGSEDMIAHLEQRLGIKVGETTPDGKATLRKVECLGCCVDAPMMQLNKDYKINLTKESLDKIVDELN